MGEGRVTVGVVGGGLAGLVAAEVLRQDGQAEVTVFERQRTSYADINARPTNGALAINMNGVAVLNSLGFSEPLKRIIGQAYAFVVYVGTTWWIRELCRSDLGFLPEKYAVPMGGVGRAELIGILSAPLIEAGCVQFNTHVVKVDVGSDGAKSTVHFEDGSAQMFDVIIGADGLNSAVRRAVAPDNSKEAAFSNISAFYGTIRGSPTFAHPELKPGVLLQILGPNTIAITYTAVASDGSPIRYFAVNTWVDEDDSRQLEPKSWASGASRGQPKAELERLTKDWAEEHPLKEVIRAASNDDIVYFGIYSLGNPKREWWSKGNAVLVGDALHSTMPYLGQGGSLAIEDGYTLAKKLIEHNFESAPAFDAFYEARHERIATIVAGGWALRNVYFRLPSILRQLVVFFVHFMRIPAKTMEAVLVHAPVPVKPRPDYVPPPKAVLWRGIMAVIALGALAYVWFV